MCKIRIQFLQKIFVIISLLLRDKQWHWKTHIVQPLPRVMEHVPNESNKCETAHIKLLYQVDSCRFMICFLSLVVCWTITQHKAASISTSVRPLMTVAAATPLSLSLSLAKSHQLFVLSYFIVINDWCYRRLGDRILQAWITSVHDQKLPHYKRPGALVQSTLPQSSSLWQQTR